MFHASFLDDQFQYEDDVDPIKAREIWEKKSDTLCRQTWSQVKEKCKKQSESLNPNDWKPYRPDFVGQEVWLGILESWMTPKWKKLSENGSKNRKSVPGDDGDCLYVRHTGGSINLSIHNERLEKQLGHKPTQLESFARVHKKQKGKGEWCDARAEKAIQKYDEKRKEKHLCEEEHPCEEDEQLELPFDPDAWLEATTLSKKKQTYGVVDLQEGKKIVSKVASSSSSSMQSHTETLTPTEIERLDFILDERGI